MTFESSDRALEDKQKGKTGCLRSRVKAHYEGAPPTSALGP